MAEVPLPTPTQAPVPSTDIRNAVFAGAKLDEEVTGSGEFYTDRLGIKRLTNTGRNNQFNAAQQERADQFQQFLLSSGYVFLGDYEDGPFQFSARNQYIRYNDQYYRLNATTDVGFTTTGTDATSFANDVTHFVLMDGDTLRQYLGSSEGEPIVASEKVRAALGGTISEAIRYVSVDGFEPDLTGATDSTLSVLKAAAIAKTLADSAYVTGDTKYYVVRYGFGIYMQGDVPMYSGINYDGQREGTLIKPLPGSSFCFTTTGTTPYDGNNLKRMFYASITNMRIGCAYYENLFPIPAGVGGIDAKYASYLKIDNVEMRGLNGPGLVLGEVWDSDINIRMMKVGNITDPDNPAPALHIHKGSGTDGSNALRFWGLHIEECPKSMQIEPGSRHIFFNSPKIEGGTTTSTIVGAAGISFSGAELTWARNDIPQISITRTDSYESFGVVFDTPQFNSGGTAPRGWYIHHEGNSGHLLISNPIGKFVKTMVTGNSWISRGGVAYACGPDFMKGTWSCTAEGLVARSIMRASTAGAAATDGTGDFIVMSGSDIVVRNCELHSAGAIDDGLAFINLLGCNSDVSCQNNDFSGARQYGVRGNISSYKVKDNSLVDGGTLAATMSAATARYSLVNPGSSGLGAGGFKSGSITIAAGAAGSLDIISGATTLLIRASSALGFPAAKIFVDANFPTVNLESNLGSIFATGSGAPGDNKVYISKSGSNLILTNNTGLAGTFYVTALSAVM
ncbi:hypothetical protein M3B69_01005 [Raoultella ornithinolytica]|uniref:hypothetical protein n=1 Tax=Raoultella ornithinolytica TaxID=54291 RepID=UPI0021A36214|nr:hypothetical protein [Raoultella ornithinolytica]MCT1678516.1 hypothetical protein [Raoultella ornithinolytica]